MPYRQGQKSHKHGLKLFIGTSKFPYNFKEVISFEILPYVELITVM